jgi:molecular chaperone GrpE
VAKKDKEKKETPVEEVIEETVAEETAAEETVEVPEVNPFEEKYNAERDAHLRLAAEFDNFRKRTVKEKESSYSNGRADAVEKILPVYDNLSRALKQETADAAFKKGVEMTMTELVKILSGLGVEIFGEVGEEFDPNIHNAVMHTENESLGENVICQVFQQGFKMGDKVIRFAMVQVAN